MSSDRPPSTCWQERWPERHRLARHCHEKAYAAVVLSGGYEECGSRGRFRVAPGDVLIHGPFDSHLDRFDSRETNVINVMLSGSVPLYGLGRLADPDSLVRLAERDPREAAVFLSGHLGASDQEPEDWPDLLARELLADPDCAIARWASRHGLAAETVSRGFRRVFGVSPVAFRLEARVRRAFTRVLESDESLTSIAAATGFADHAHMSRGIGALTGRPPRHWQRSNRFKTAPGRSD